MGCIKSLKPAIKQIRSELKRAAMQDAHKLVLGLGAAIADGRLTKDEARTIATEALQHLHDLRRSAAEAAVLVAVRAMEAGVVRTDLDDDDSDSEPLAV